MRHSTARRGFTLIELLVTMALIIVLLSIAVAVSNSAAVDSYKLVGSADKVAQSLLTAKSRALRDKAPRGIRFNIEAGTNNVRELIYIESGDPWLPDQSYTLSGVTAYEPNRSMFVIKYPQNGPISNTVFLKPDPNLCRAYVLLTANDLARFNLEVKIGDTAYSPDLGAAVVINNITTSTLEWAPGLTAIDLGVPTMVNPDMAAGYTPTTTVNRSTFQTTQFGIYRSPRPIAGEPTTILSKNVAIDTAASLNITPGVSFDVLFAPSGQVMNISQGLLALTVRDTFKFPNPTPPGTGVNWLADSTVGPGNFKLAGEMVLIGIYPKTGTVATKPVNDPTGPSDVYKFVKDAINSGL